MFCLRYLTPEDLKIELVWITGWQRFLRKVSLVPLFELLQEKDHVRVHPNAQGVSLSR